MKATKDILDFPWMTEKSTAIRATANQYVFKVKTSANKIEIKQAIEARFQVKVVVGQYRQRAGQAEAHPGHPRPPQQLEEGGRPSPRGRYHQGNRVREAE